MTSRSLYTSCCQARFDLSPHRSTGLCMYRVSCTMHIHNLYNDHDFPRPNVTFFGKENRQQYSCTKEYVITFTSPVMNENKIALKFLVYLFETRSHLFYCVKLENIRLLGVRTKPAADVDSNFLSYHTSYFFVPVPISPKI